jgi:uncharacterized membrane protein YgcG
MTFANPLLLIVGALTALLNFKIDQPVVDRQNFLSPETRGQVAASVRHLRTAAGAQLAVVLIDSTQGEPIEELTHRLATTWKGGRRGHNDGLLLLLAVGDRKSRLEVGSGLQSQLPDSAAQKLLDGMRPALREKDYGTALTQVIGRMEKRLLGQVDEADAAPTPANAAALPAVPVARPVLPANERFDRALANAASTASTASPSGSSGSSGSFPWFFGGIFVFVAAWIVWPSRPSRRSPDDSPSTVMFDSDASTTTTTTTDSVNYWSSSVDTTTSTIDASPSSSIDSSTDSNSGGGGDFGGGGASSSW